MSEKFIVDYKVNFLAIIKFLWSKRKKIILITLIGAILGLLNAKFSHKIFASSSTVIPNESSSGKFKGLSGLASLAGITMGSNDGGNISPALYSEILGSYTFRQKILNQKINVSKTDTPVTFIEFFENVLPESTSDKIKKHTIGLPFLILKSFKSDDSSNEINTVIQKTSQGIANYSKLEQRYISKIENILSIDVDEMSGAFTINCEFPDNIGSAEIVNEATKILQSIIIDIKIKKANNNYQFLMERYHEEKEKFEEIQNKLARFEDSHLNSVSSVINHEKIALQAKYNLRNQVYSELARQLESSKMALQKDTPVFTVVKDAVIPAFPFEPSTIKSIIMASFLFSFIFTAFILIKTFIKQFKSA